MGMPFQRQFDQLFRGERAIRLKVGGGVLVALYLTLQSADSGAFICPERPKSESYDRC